MLRQPTNLQGTTLDYSSAPTIQSYEPLPKIPTSTHYNSTPRPANASRNKPLSVTKPHTGSELLQLRRRSILSPISPGHLPAGNIDLNFKLIDISNMDEVKHTVDIEFECITTWTPALWEAREAAYSSTVGHVTNLAIWKLLLTESSGKRNRTIRCCMAVNFIFRIYSLNAAIVSGQEKSTS
jgi:hypothetical protein